MSHSRNVQNVTATHQHDITIRHYTDTKACGVSAVIILPDERLAAIDIGNDCVKLFDVALQQVCAKIRLASVATGLALIEEDLIGVTLLGERYIQVLSINPALSKHHTIAVNGFYKGILYVSNKLILVCQYPKTGVHIYSLSGAMLRKIENDQEGNALFSMPSNIAVSPDRNVLYINDKDEGTTVSLTIDGILITKHKSGRYALLRVLAVDDDGYVYVCDEESSTVQQLSPSGQLVKQLLDKKDGIKQPWAIAYNARKLYICLGNPHPPYSGNIKVYKLENEQVNWN